MTSVDYEQVIVQGIRDLPESMLAEIADFVLFIRQRAFLPTELQDNLYSAMLALEGQIMSRSEQQHLEEEFAKTYESYTSGNR